MSLATVRSPFALSDYTPLPEHQEQTPESFYDGKPVLHYHATGAKAWIPKSQRGKLPFFPADLSSAPTAPDGGALSNLGEEHVEQIVDIFVNSQYEVPPTRTSMSSTSLTHRDRNLAIFCPSAECGASIPYQQVSIHAIKTLHADSQAGQTTYPSVYLQIELGAGDEDDFDTVELILVPQQQSQPARSTEPETASPQAPKSETVKLFEAISECSNLNPDPVQDGDEDDGEDGAQIIFEGDHEAIEGFSGVFAGARDGGLPPAMPGSSGWITAENVHEYFDEEGNWIGGDEEGVSGELGNGAGTVHGRSEEDEEAASGTGAGEEGESKRVRTE